jgi:CheY-like chemotaxis protein
MTPSPVRRPVQILLAEDNPGDVRLIREAFRQHDMVYEMSVVEDGQEALAYLDSLTSQPEAAAYLDLIVLDLNMPKSDGREILRRLRDSPHFQDVPVMVLSSSDSPHDRVETAELGARCYVRKPSTLDEFLEIGAVAKDLALGQAQAIG